MTDRQNNHSFPDLAVIAWARPDLLQETLESINSCYNINLCNLLIHIDAPNASDNQSKKEQNKEVREVCNRFLQHSKAKETRIIEPQSKLGCWKSKINAINNLLESWNSDYVALIEDDTPVAKDALVYFSDCKSLLISQEAISLAGLYSPFGSFETNEKLEVVSNTQNRMLAWLEGEPSIFKEIVVVEWAFQWGFAMLKKHYEKALPLWSGRDQVLAELIREQKGLCLSPVISRSQHRGVESSLKKSAVPITQNCFFDYLRSSKPDIFTDGRFHHVYPGLMQNRVEELWSKIVGDAGRSSTILTFITDRIEDDKALFNQLDPKLRDKLFVRFIDYATDKRISAVYSWFYVVNVRNSSWRSFITKHLKEVCPNAIIGSFSTKEELIKYLHDHML